MTKATDPPNIYNSRDNEIIANNVFRVLCDLYMDDKKKHRKIRWHDLHELAKKVKGYHDYLDVARITEFLLEDHEYIQRKPGTNNIQLTKSGRKNCHRWI